MTLNIMALTAEVKHAIKSTITGSYSQKVVDYLKEKKLKKKNKKPYTRTEVKHVFNGYRTNNIILNAILAVYENEKQQAQALQERLNAIANQTTK